MMTAAAAELAGKRKKWPPPADAEHAQRVGKLVDALRPSLPPEIVARLDDGSVAVGEFGEAHPDVATWPLDHQQYVVGFSTGMFRFIDCVASAIGRIFVDGASPTADPAFDAAVADLRDALTVFRRQDNPLWNVLAKPTFADAAVPADERSAQFVRDLIELTARFMLAHEFGHVAIGIGLEKSSDEREETDADRIGLLYALRSAFVSSNQGLAVTAAGLAVRVYVSLQRFGVRFSGVYGSMATRLETLNAALVALLGAQQKADELSRVMVAMLDAMDDIDTHIMPALGATPMTVDRLRVGIIARLYELARGGTTMDMFLADMAELRRYTTPENFANAFTAVCDYYWPWADTAGMYVRGMSEQSTYDHGWIIANSRALRDAVAHLSDADRAFLPPNYRAHQDAQATSS